MSENRIKAGKEIKVRMTLLEEMLGGRPGNPDLLKTYIASKAPEGRDITDEIEARGEENVIEDRMTGFEKEKGMPYMYDYHIKGFLKEAWKACKQIYGSACSKTKAYKSKIDDLIFLAPEDRHIFFHNPDGSFVMNKQITECERPLRAETMQGPRVSIARSEAIPAGSYIEFTLLLLDPNLEDAVRECFDYSKYKALGQWRNSGKGRCKWEEIV